MSRYRWVILAVGTVAQTSFSGVAIGLPALAPALRSSYRLSLNETGVVLAAVGIGMLPTLLPWGLAADRVGERAVLAAGLGAAAVALAATGWTRSFGGLTAGLVAAGVFGASVNAASGRAVMGWFGSGQRGLALGIRQTAAPLGGASAAAGLPWLAQAGGIRLAFLVLAGACLTGALAGLAWLRESPGPLVSPPTTEAPPLRDRGMWILSGASALYCVAQIAVTGFLVLFLHEHRGMSAGAAAGVLAGTHVLGATSRIAVGRRSDRIHARIAPLRLLGFGLAASLALTAAVADAPLSVLLPALVVAGVFGLSWNGLSFTAAAESAGTGRSGAAIGFQQTALCVSTATVPILFAALVNVSSWRVAFAASALAPLAGTLALRRVPEASSAGRPSGARLRGTSASLPAARGTRD